MSAPTLKPVKPRNRLRTLATVLTWVFWLAVAVTALQLIPAVTRSGALFISAPNSQPNALVCLNAAQQLLQHAGIGLSHPGLSPGVRATWNTASVCTAHPTGGQYLAFAVTLLPLGLLRLGALYLVMRRPTPPRPTASTPPSLPAAADSRPAGCWPVGRGHAEVFARMTLLGQLVTWHPGWGQWPAAYSVSWPVFWFGRA